MGNTNVHPSQEDPAAASTLGHKNGGMYAPEPSLSLLITFAVVFERHVPCALWFVDGCRLANIMRIIVLLLLTSL